MSNDIPPHSNRAIDRILAGNYPIALWIILLVALALRLWHASNHAFTPDEVPNIRLAQSIHLGFSDPRLVFTSQGHPLLVAYMAYFGALLFGESLLGYRSVMVLIGALTCWAVYRVGREVDSKAVGLWAAALIAVDQFHVTMSGSLNNHDVPMIFFGTLALLSCSRITPEANLRPFIGMGLWMGFAYLGKETALMLFPALWIFMFLSKDRRSVLLDPRWYLAHAVCAVVVAPDIIWNLTHTSAGGYMEESAGKAFGGTFQVQGKVLSMFVGELLMKLDPMVIGEDYWFWPLRTMHWVAGLLYIYATFWAWRFRQRPIVFLLQIAFLVIVLVVTLMPGRTRFDPFWWASMAMSPAIILSGLYLEEWVRRSRKSLWLIAPLLLWLLVRTAHSISGVPFFQDGRV